MKELWTDWPNRELGGLMKAYLLWELVYYTQQCLILNIEERRKDHWQMFSHHLITIVLIYGSYRFGHTRVGNVILVLMDTVDVVLVVRHLWVPLFPFGLYTNKYVLRSPSAPNTSASPECAMPSSGCSCSRGS